MQLVEELYGDEHRILEQIQTFAGSLPDRIPVLPLDDVQQLSLLAEQVEEGKRRGSALKVLVHKLVRAPERKTEIHKAHAEHLGELYERALIDGVQTRVCELRGRLAQLPANKNGLVWTVTRAPYKLVQVPCALSEDELKTVTAVYMMIDRLAWRTRPSRSETKAFQMAQERFRRVLATGMGLADDGMVLPHVEGVPKSLLGDAVREKLDWVSEVSSMLQNVFETFYRPCCDVPDSERFHVAARWATPHMGEVVNFFNASRNEILTVMNVLFRSAGLRPYRLIQGHDFPAPWFADGAIPNRPVLMTPEELRETHRTLREIGIDHLQRPAA